MNINLPFQSHFFLLRLGLFKIAKIKSNCVAINQSNIHLYKDYTQCQINDFLKKTDYFKIDDINVNLNFIEKFETGRKVYKGNNSNLINYYINLVDGYDNYIADMKSKYKKELRREVRRFYEAFESVTIVYFNKSDEVDTFMADMKNIHSKSWKKGTLNEVAKASVTKLTSQCEWLGVVLYANGKPISYMHGILNSDNEYLLINNGYDDDYKNLKSGKVLISKIIENHMQFDIKAIDFGSGSSTYKKIFCNDSNKIYSSLITSKGSSYAFLFQVQIWLDNFYMFIKRISEKLNFAHKLREIVRSR